MSGESENFRTLSIQHALAVGALNTAISLLENYGQHHRWCATVKYAAHHTCDCGYESELYVIRQQRKMVESDV